MSDLITVGTLFKAGAGEVFRRLQAHRLEEARRILLKRLGRGEHWAILNDEAAAALFSYIRAAQEGAAGVNLDLLAQAIAGNENERTFAPDEFRRWARIISELTRDEVLVLAGLLKADIQAQANGKSGDGSQNVGDLCAEAMAGPGKPFKAQGEVRACLSALIRTGFVELVSYYGTMGFIPTSNLHAIARVISFEEAIRESDATEKPHRHDG
jgi:hypothetical protein